MTDWIGLLWRTLRHLTLRQVMYQAFNRLRGPGQLRFPRALPAGQFLAVPNADKPMTWRKNTFTFLNQPVLFSGPIDWNYAANGRLWTYNLNYFDYLNQPTLTPTEGMRLIRDFMDQTARLKDGLEPYPTSLRLVNWVQFVSRHRIQNKSLNAHLFAQTALLRRRFEYHLAGNHLLENGFALLIGSLYFRNRGWFRMAARQVYAQLTRQILPDGGHDERSPMYHQILLDRLLIVLTALRTDDWHNAPAFVQFLDQTAGRMRAWLDAITFANGDVPMVNDATHTGKPSWRERSPVGAVPGLLTATGYRMFRRDGYELFADVGSVGSNQQPGHAHADTFSFVLYVNNQPVVVDSGTSTYEPGPRRAWDRSTAAHNTVEVGGQNSSEVWAGFRVGRRAQVTLQDDTDTRLTARHDGYRPWRLIHERSWSVDAKALHISDRLIPTAPSGSEPAGIARFHLFPGLPITVTEQEVLAGPVRLAFTAEAKLSLHVVPYELANGFNRLRSGQCLEVRFLNGLNTLIIPTA